MRTDLCNDSSFCLPEIRIFIKSCIFSWLRNSTLHFNPCRNFRLSSWADNFSEILLLSLYQDFGPNWTCPYLWDLAEWIDDNFDRAFTLFFNFLNRASSLTITLLRDVSSDLTSSLLLISNSSLSTSTLPLSTPAFWTRFFRRFV